MPSAPAAARVSAPGEIARGDLAALVAMLQHEHFTYDGRGAAAARALKGLTVAVDAGVTFLAITDEAGA